MSFSDTQVQALASKLSAKHVRTRQAKDRTLSYIEGWHAISEANRIFGFDAWDRQTMVIRCVWEDTWQGRYACAYVARVRVKVRAGDREICREGCGSGQGRGNTPGEAHESALKEAETDAMKRALSTFGNPFGLALYDKEQRAVRGKPRPQRPSNGPLVSWIVLTAEGDVSSVHEDPTDYCKALRQMLEASSTPERLTAVWNRNTVTIEMLRANLPDLKTESGEHYADVLLRLYRTQLKELLQEQRADQEAAANQKLTRVANTPMTPGNGEASQASMRDASPTAASGSGAVSQAKDRGGYAQVTGVGKTGAHTTPALAVEPSKSSNLDKPQVNEQKRCQLASGAGAHTGDANREPLNLESGRVDKSALAISAPRRIRNKEHLRFVASKPCLVCGRTPSHAHHIRFAQPRALGRKVSDEWVVPLCATHHRSLHTVGDEQRWWKIQGVDPIACAQRLWCDSRGQIMDQSSRTRALISPTPS